VNERKCDVARLMKATNRTDTCEDYLYRCGSLQGRMHTNAHERTASMFVNSGLSYRTERVSLSAMVFLGGYLDVRNRGGYLVAHGLLSHGSHSDVSSHS
jgi:hypothetical protein